MATKESRVKTYTIEISESQRVGLMELFEGFGGDGCEPRELCYWLGMLRELPQAERNGPGTTHCFHA
jgi:hypothetical protein